MSQVQQNSKISSTNPFQLATLGKAMLSASKFYSSYARYDEEQQCYERWEEAVERVMGMHREKYADKMTLELEELLKEAQEAYNEKLILGAQRALQFGGPQLRKHEAKMYNCSASYADRPIFFSGAMYLLLCGCGVGFSVQRRHVAKLPEIARRDPAKTMVFTVPDSIEGWADAYGVLLSSFFVERQQFPEYAGVTVVFDFGEIRPNGSLISGGFKAPGHEGLQKSLEKCQELLELQLENEERTKLRPIVAYDFVMHMSDAVLAGGVRRSATLCMFDKDDQEMLKAKTGNWFAENPQRARSNNSAVLKRDDITREEWAAIFANVRSFGEPGFVFVKDYEVVFNPCVEIGMRAYNYEGVSGFQFCNLVETNGAQCTTPEKFYRACRAAAILATLQAGYTNFKYLCKATREITEREALLGVSITGWMNNPHVLFDKDVLKKGAEIVKEVNRLVAALIGINPAARTTCGKPSGNASTLLGTAPGIHGVHAHRYLRNIQLNANEEVAALIQQTNPLMVEKSLWSSMGTDVVVSYPIEESEHSVFRMDVLGVKFLEKVKLAQQHWVENGTNVELCTAPHLRHNISNTVSVDNWDEVEQYLFENRDWFTGVSLLSASGDKDYAQAPYTEVYTEEQVQQMYGHVRDEAEMLINQAESIFGEVQLWPACQSALNVGEFGPNGQVMTTEHTSWNAEKMLGVSLASFFGSETWVADLHKAADKVTWVTALHKFADSKFNGNLTKATYCLKDIHNLNRWNDIVRNAKSVDFAKELGPKTFVDINTLGAQACSGGVCEFTL